MFEVLHFLGDHDLAVVAVVALGLGYWRLGRWLSGVAKQLLDALLSFVESVRQSVLATQQGLADQEALHRKTHEKLDDLHQDVKRLL